MSIQIATPTKTRYAVACPGHVDERHGWQGADRGVRTYAAATVQMQPTFACGTIVGTKRQPNPEDQVALIA